MASNPQLPKTDSFLPDTDSFVADSFVPDTAAPRKTLGFLDRLRLSPSITAKDVLTRPLIPISEAVEPLAREHLTPITGAATLGVARFAEQLTAPGTLALMAAIGPLASADLEFVGFLTSVGFGVDQAINAWKSYKQSEEVQKAGDPLGAMAGKVEAGLSAALGLGVPFHVGKQLRAKTNYATRIDGIRKGIDSPYRTVEDLQEGREWIKDQKLKPEDEAFLLARLDKRANELRAQGPLVAKAPMGPPAPPGQPPQMGTVAAQAPLTVRQQMGVPQRPAMLTPVEQPVLPEAVIRAREIERIQAEVRAQARKEAEAKTRAAALQPKPQIPATLPQEPRSQPPPTPAIPPQAPVAAPRPLLETYQPPTTVSPAVTAVAPAAVAPPAAPARKPIVLKERKPTKWKPETSIISALRHIGGLNPKTMGPYAGAREMELLRRQMIFRNDSPHGPDTALAELGNYGYQIKDPGELVAILLDPVRRKQGLKDIAEASELEQAKYRINELEGELSELTSFNPEELQPKMEVIEKPPELPPAAPVEVPRLAEEVKATPTPSRSAREAEIRRLQQGISDGELRLRSKVDALGKKLSPEELNAVSKSVTNARNELATLLPREEFIQYDTTKREAAGMRPEPLIADDIHESAVRKAVEGGRPVAPEVLADYPELTKPSVTEELKAAAAPAPGPFTPADIERMNRFTNFPTDLETANRRALSEREQLRQEVSDRLKRYGITEIPRDVEDALNGVLRASVQITREFSRAREIAPGAYIVGPSNYLKHARPERARAIEKKAGESYDAAKEYLDRAIKRHSPNAAISADKANAPELLINRIAKAEKLQETMRQANVIVRKKGLTGEQKIAELGNLGIVKPVAEEVLKGQYGRPGFQQYEFQNNLANINRMKERVKGIEETRAVGSSEWEFDGGKILDNAEDNRIQILFDSKPHSQMIMKLKSRGFKWAPSSGAWQRQRTENARYATMTLLRDKMPEGQAGQFLHPERKAAVEAPAPTVEPEPEVPPTPEPAPTPKEPLPPVSAAADQFAAIEEARRATYLEEIQKRVLQAPDTATATRREQLGLTKPKGPVRETPLFGEPQKGLFGGEEGFAVTRQPEKIDWEKVGAERVPINRLRYGFIDETGEAIEIPYYSHPAFMKQAKGIPPSVRYDMLKFWDDARAANLIRIVKTDRDVNIQLFRPPNSRQTSALSDLVEGIPDENITYELSPISRGNVFGKTKREMMARAGRQEYWGEEGFAVFKDKPLADDDPQVKNIFERMDRAKRIAKSGTVETTPRPHEPDIPASNVEIVTGIRSTDHALERVEATRPVVDTIHAAHYQKQKEVLAYKKKAVGILKEANLKHGTDDRKMVIELLDAASTGMSPDKLRASAAYRGNKEAAIRAAQRLRDEIFEPIIQDIRTDPKLIAEIGRRGYISGYFPHWAALMKKEYGAGYTKVMAELLPKQFLAAVLKERKLNEPYTDLNLEEVLSAYITSTMRTKHDIPAYAEARAIVEGLPDGPWKDSADWYIKNYMGDPTVRDLSQRSQRYQNLSHAVAQANYDALIGANYPTYMLNLAQNLNTIVKVGPKYWGRGVEALFRKEGRKLFEESGLLLDSPGIDPGVRATGKVRSFLHAGMRGTEYVNRGVAFLSGIEQAKEMGLPPGLAREMHALRVVRDTQFEYGKASPNYRIQRAAPHMRVFQTYPAKQMEFMRNIVQDGWNKGILKGDVEARRQFTRFLMVAVGLPAVAAAAGVSVGRAGMDATDIVPGVPVPLQIVGRTGEFLWQVRAGRKKMEDVPKQIVFEFARAFVPGFNAARNIGKQTGIIEQKRKAQ